MISPAPIYPSGLRPVAAAGAGGQFATGLRLTSWDEDAGFAAREDDADRTGTSPGRVGGIQRRWVWIGTVGPVKDGHANAGLGMERHGEAWLYVTPRNGGNFSRLDSTCLGWARQCSAGRGTATRYPERNLGQFHAARLDKSWQGTALRAVATTRAWRGIQAQFHTACRGTARPGLAMRVRAWRGNTLPRAESGTISKAQLDTSWQCTARRGNNVTGDGNPGHFPKHQEAPASRGATVDGMTGSV